MIVCNKTLRFGTEVVNFRQKHPSESFKGKSGLFALTQCQEFDINILWVEAANDLAAADLPNVEKNPVYLAAMRAGPVGVAVCIMHGSSENSRLRLAAKCNQHLWPTAA